MKNIRRSFLKLLGFSYLSAIFLPYNLAHSAAKKIMLDQATEKPFSSPLNFEKRKGFFHCANCDAKLFSSDAKFDSGTGWPSFSESLPGAF